ncbi:739_t:CDS:1, partial [Acaulospora colombiana]
MSITKGLRLIRMFMGTITFRTVYMEEEPYTKSPTSTRFVRSPQQLISSTAHRSKTVSEFWILNINAK